MGKKILVVLTLLLWSAGWAAAALVNVSQGKPATASSLWTGTNAGMVTDGATWAPWPIYHSGNGDYDPWVMVDLQQTELIKQITLWNRRGCCWIRMQDIQVEILDANQHIVAIAGVINPGNILGFGSQPSAPQSATLTLDHTIPGQYVRVRRIPNPAVGGGSAEEIDHADDYILSLNELQVFADADVPSIAWGPSPYPGETAVPLEVTLSWNTSALIDPNVAGEGRIYPNADVLTHAVYLSSGKVSDPNLVWLADVPAGDPVTAGASYGPITIDRDGMYYWRVDEIGLDPNGNPVVLIPGVVWRFDAVTSFPSIEQMPADQFVKFDETAVFTVSATNPLTGDATGLSYAWFKVDSAGDIPVGENADTLSILATDLSVEGRYYCIVTLDANGNTATSDTAGLTIKRLLHHWPFEGTMEDVVGGRDGTALGDPDLSVPGIVGNYAVDLDTDDAVTIAGDEEYVDAFTVSAWVRHRGLPNNFHALLHQDGWTAGSIHFHLRSDESFSMGVNGRAGDLRTAAGVIPNPDQWYFVVMTDDGLARRAYRDGELVAENVYGTVPSTAQARPLPGTLGAWNNNGNYTRFLDGMLDDVRIYNYALEPEEVARLYYDVTGKPTCLNPPAIDLNDDCEITLEDFALMAAEWSACNLVPASACQ